MKHFKCLPHLPAEPLPLSSGMTISEHEPYCPPRSTKAKVYYSGKSPVDKGRGPKAWLTTQHGTNRSTIICGELWTQLVVIGDCRDWYDSACVQGDLRKIGSRRILYVGALPAVLGVWSLVISSLQEWGSMSSVVVFILGCQGAGWRFRQTSGQSCIMRYPSIANINLPICM